jgi:pantetheine-phosphate adenylyltransferase
VTRALYPGTFDPVTNGHLDLMRRALGVFGELVVAVAQSPRKQPLFSLEERVGFVREATREWKNITVVGFDGLLMDLARGQRAEIVIKGLRAISDFEYEFQMALMNRKLDPSVETAFLMPSEEYTYLSANLVKELASMGGALHDLVPEVVERALRQRFANPVEKG